MKKILILMLTIYSISLTAQEINWMNFNEALIAQQNSPKKIFVDAYTPWCGWCKKLDATTFKNPDVVDFMNKNYYAVKFNAEGNETINYKGKVYSNPNYKSNSRGRNSSHELSNLFKIRSFPTVMFLDEQANLITPVPGYKTASQLELFLKFFNSTNVKSFTQEAWESYTANFTPTFKD
ncbi:MAG: thioredoxin family protein [Flavobacteriaceae bacterium]|nr:MAG: thioredoxin family protein [Flavobacteriaceae bacterium]